jgi:hypothetical protein
LSIRERNDVLSISISDTFTAYIREVLAKNCHASVIMHCGEVAELRSDFPRWITLPRNFWAVILRATRMLGRAKSGRESRARGNPEMTGAKKAAPYVLHGTALKTTLHFASSNDQHQNSRTGNLPGAATQHQRFHTRAWNSEKFTQSPL